MAAAMRAADSGASPAEAGAAIVDAIKSNAMWVFPGADRHRPLVEQDFASLLGAVVWSRCAPSVVGSALRPADLPVLPSLLPAPPPVGQQRTDQPTEGQEEADDE